MSRICIFSDLDNTWIYSRRKIDKDKKYKVASLDKQGNSSSFIYNDQLELLNSLIKNPKLDFIPTTARDFNSYHRTFFSREENIDKAILNFGGIVLKNGDIDKEWENIILSGLNQLEVSISEVFKFLSSYGVLRTSIKDDIFVVSYVDSIEPSVYEPIISKIFEEINGIDLLNEYYIHFYDRTIAVIPNFISKEEAVKYLIEEESPTFTIGMGDTHTDRDFMKHCDLILFPNQSQIFNQAQIFSE